MMRMIPKPWRTLGGLLLLFFLSPLLPAAEGPDWKADTLTGDRGGVRTRLSERGVTLEVVLKADVLSNVSGGMKRGTKYMDNWDIKLLADADKLWGWNDTTAFLQLISNHGGKLNETHVGSFMGVDNIEVNANTTKLFHAWLESSFFDRKFSVLVGLYPVDSQFYVTDATGVFPHPTGGMAAEVAQTGVNGPSIFPTSSFGVRAMWQATPKFYLQAALVDGVPGDPDNPRGTHIRFERGDGTLAIVETGFRPAEEISKYAVGTWRYSARFDDLVDTDASGNPERRVNRGAYFLAEQTVSRETDDSSQGLALFLRYGVANGDVNTLDYSFSLGLRYKGLVPGRDEDEFGILLTRGHAGAKFIQAAATPLETNETALEITYRARVVRWLAIQPTLQRIFNPGFDPALRDARVAGARFEVAF
ncbi:MAG: carbohydrate porin [Burkholderiales bacterium]